MNKAELLVDLENKAIEILGTTGPNPLNGGHKEYEVNCVMEVSHNVCEERIIPIRVIGEGTPEEKAYYVKAPPTNRESVLAAELDKLLAAGTVTANSLSNLGISFADFNMDGQRIFVTMLNEETRIINGV
jgi:hypothetical protein